MSITIRPTPSALPADLVSRVEGIDVPTFGHFLEEGFTDIGLRRLSGSAPFCGRAITVSAAPGDSTLIHRAIGGLEKGDVLVVDTDGETAHAAFGGLALAGVLASGAVAVILDGVTTDLDVVRASNLPLYARGTSALTTKLLGLNVGSINSQIRCGGVTVEPGFFVLGNENGVLMASAETIESVVAAAQASDDAEPAMIARIQAGEKLHNVSRAGSLLANIGVES